MMIFPLVLLYYLLKGVSILRCEGIDFKPLKFRVDEGLPVGSLVGVISNRTDKYSISTPVFTDFAVNSNGHLTTNKVFDYEKLTETEKAEGIKMTIQVASSSFLIYYVTVHIEDLNDNAPAFPVRVYPISVKEDITSSEDLYFPNAVDPDYTDRIIDYSIVSGDIYNDFQIELRVGADQKEEYVLELVDGRQLDVETKSDFLNLTISACDKGSVFCDFLQVAISIEDVNDNKPSFQYPRKTIEIFENVSHTVPIFKVKATDPDRGLNGQVEYKFFGYSEFRIDSHTGDVFVLPGKLDAEKEYIKNMLIIAEDKGTPISLKDIFHLTVRILDCNDKPPKLTVHPRGSGPVTLAEGMPVGTVVGSHTAVDNDLTPANNEISEVKLTKGDDYFALERTKDETLNGNQVMKYFIKTIKEIDREITSAITLSAFATDTGNPPMTGTVNYVVHVMDVNDNYPVFEKKVYEATINESKPIGAFVIQVKATDADDGANAQISYFITAKSTQRWFYIDEDTGKIILNDVIDREEHSTFTIDIAARDHGTNSLTSYARVIVTILDTNDNDPRFVERDMKFRLDENNKRDVFIGMLCLLHYYLY